VLNQVVAVEIRFVSSLAMDELFKCDAGYSVGDF
jgi:hypothetical protein